MRELPSGTVTLLFTDIEGSTRLLQQLGNRYDGVLIECRQLLRAAFQRWNGYEVDTQGDAFFVAFARATDALAAAVDAQHTFSAYSWPEGVTVRVRIGLHTGEPELAAEGYVGLDVHWAARIMSAGHGGQVLLSQTTRDLVEHDLPEGASLRDLGAQRLKDLQHPSHLFQLVMADLPADFPLLKTLDTHPNNLPIQPTLLIGREKEVAALERLLPREDVRLLTLTGPGGTGKTRLGLQIAAELNDRFPDGVFFVNLAPISDPALVIPTIAQTLEVKEIAEQSLVDQLKTSLRDKQLLLLLDNFEQVVDAAVQVADLLEACPKLKVIVTSRAVLHVRGEQEFAVPPLAVPDPNHLPDLVALSQYEAVALFILRAQAIKPEFQITTANAPAIAEICARLDGLPLAIELAAARIKLLPPQALLARLGQRLAVLTSGVRDAPARQQTLRNTIAWSYHLLDVEEQRLFRRLSIFVGGCILEAGEVVCNAANDLCMNVLEGMASLLDKSLLLQIEQEGQEPRLLILETIREYGLECLTESGELEITQRAHALYYLDLAEAAELQFNGPQQALWFKRLEQEYDNLRAAMRWSVEQGEAGQSMEIALRLGGALRQFWMVRGHWGEGRAFLERVLARGQETKTSAWAKALIAAGGVALVQGDLDRVEELAQETLVLYKALGDTAGIAFSLYRLGNVALIRGNLVGARSLIEESVALSRELGSKDHLMYALGSLQNIAFQQGEYAKARTYSEELLVLSRERGNKRGIAFSLFDLARVRFVSQGDAETARSLIAESLTLLLELDDKLGISDCYSLLGEIALSQGDVTEARLLFEHSLVLSREMGNGFDTALVLAHLAKVAAVQGNHAEARALYEESLGLAREGNYKYSVAPCLEGLAMVVAAQGELAWAVRLWGVAEILRETMGAPLPPFERADYEQAVSRARTRLGEKAFTICWAEGRAMTPEQVLAAQGTAMMPQQVSKVPQSITSAKIASAYPAGLTAREVEVLCLVAQGLTDAQVAEQLVISPRTVNWHMTSIYSKLQVSSRSAATRYAIEHKLV